MGYINTSFKQCQHKSKVKDFGQVSKDNYKSNTLCVHSTQTKPKVV